MTTRKLLIVGNWKMNGSIEFTDSLLKKLTQSSTSFHNDVAVLPPYVYLTLARGLLTSSPIQLGAQEVSAHFNGAYTGEISISMLKDVGCQYVLIGHSERRQYHHENDEAVAQKAALVYENGLTPIICLGETEQEREKNLTFSVIDKQLAPLLALPDVLSQSVLAYEPVWAIGTGKTAEPAQAQEIHHYIRQKIALKTPSIAEKIRILYGGSVKADNAHNLFSMPDIDGGLIGGASLKQDEFIFLCEINCKR